ncbi:hypothetical protein O1L55_04895 [Streptomyces albulus]|nr:hypothetical protein [Streptomyces noursei]
MATTQTQTGRELLGLFPPGTTRDGSGGLVIGGVPAAELAESYGTPALILDEASVRARARRYADGLAARWPNSRTVFASKAFPAPPSSGCSRRRASASTWPAAAS